MKKRRIFNWSEKTVGQILGRRLPSFRYQICPKMRLSDVIEKEPGEHLPQHEFDYLSRSHLDFVIVPKDYPTEAIFGVEFDGPHHNDPDQVKRDILKNRLCKSADLALLRVQPDEIHEYDKISVLDYMLMRYRTFERACKRIAEERDNHLSTLSADKREQLLSSTDWAAIEMDPSFHYNLRNPFPAIRSIRQRLWEKYSIDWMYWSPRPEARFVCGVSFGATDSNPNNNQFTMVERIAIVNRLGVPRPTRLAFRKSTTASVRSWLPIAEFPPSNQMRSLADAKTIEELGSLSAVWQRKIQAMWFPDIPGISAYDIADTFAEYLAYRAVEDWAEENLAARER